MDGDKPRIAVGGCQPGAHRILPPVATGGDFHPVISRQLAKRLLGRSSASLGDNDHNPPGRRVTQEGIHRIGQNRASAKIAELLFQPAAHARAASRRDNDGGQAGAVFW